MKIDLRLIPTAIRTFQRLLALYTATTDIVHARVRRHVRVRAHAQIRALIQKFGIVQIHDTVRVHEIITTPHTDMQRKKQRKFRERNPIKQTGSYLHLLMDHQHEV